MNSPAPSPTDAECPSPEELEAYVDGRLSGARRAIVARHLNVCLACRSTYDLFGPKPSSGAASTDRPDLRGLQIDEYQVIEPIGGGGMGVVYKARHAKLQHIVALKMLTPSAARDAAGIARFKREMEAIGSLVHPNIVRATDAGDANGCHYLVMEYVEGIDVNRLAKLCGPLRVPDACELVRQAAAGLQYIHERRRVHRDIKPSNLLLSREGQVKILDLGLALIHEGPAKDDELTRTNQVMGTADYMAPEQATDPHNVDIRADLYGLGCTLFKLLTGTAPYTEIGECKRKKRKAEGERVRPNLAARRPDVPPALTALVHQLLAKDPAERPAEPSALAVGLARFVAGSDLAALAATGLLALQAQKAQDKGEPIERRETIAFSPPPQPPPVMTPTPRLEDIEAPGRRRLDRRLLLGGLLALLAIGAVIVFVVIRKDDSPKNGPPPLPWPADYPAVLKERPWGKPVPLVALRPARPNDPADPLRAATAEKPGPTFQPAWVRRLVGRGVYAESSRGLVLRHYGEDLRPGLTMLALDDDLERRWFELNVELKPSPPQGFFGLFFGWRETSADVARLYVVYVESPAAKQGRLVFGPAELRFKEATPQLVPLAPEKSHIEDLSAPGNPTRLSIRATPQMIRILVNGKPLIETTPQFDARGPLGIWAQNEKGYFGEISITALSLNDD